MKEESIFSSFTSLYSISKTLRFELVPIGNTRNKMNENLEYNSNLQTFLKDQKIEDAYQVLKPILDKIHEEFITNSMESSDAKDIDFSSYFDLRSELLRIDKKGKESEFLKKEKEFEGEEDRLRKLFESVFEKQGSILTQSIRKDDDNDDDSKGFRKLLKAKNLLLYVGKNINNLSKNEEEKIKIGDALSTFKGFTTYFGGFEINRENYYVTKEEKATAVVTRIVNENLPKFTDNILLFNKGKDKYLSIFQFLKDKNIVLKNKDNEDLYKIEEELFSICYFNNCLSQNGIEYYNKKIGNANFLINLFNQHKGENELKLSQFKTLYKQIGCGVKKDFVTLINNEDGLQDTLKIIYEAGQKYFVGTSRIDEEKYKIEDFIALLKSRNNYEGIYWNKQAINTISGKYFANWYDLLDKLMDKKVFQKASKEADEKIKIPDAVELSDLFVAIDDKPDNNWKDKGVFFKSSIFEGDNAQRNNDIIQKLNTPSQALLNLILADLGAGARCFVNNKNIIENGTIKITNFRNDEEKMKIKLWLDDTLAVNRILKYFITKESKRKGNLQDSDIENLLDKLISEFDWFKNYDAVRNYLTRKTGSDINKLKLNFEKSTLAGGWDTNKETDNYCIILQDENSCQYLAILKDDNKLIFEQNDENEIYKNDNLGWNKMNYKLLPGPNKMLPKVFLFSKKWIKNNPTPQNVKEIYKKGSFKKGSEFNTNDLHELINFYKDELKKYPSENDSWNRTFDFHFSDTNKYESIDQFYGEVEKQGYRLDFIPINKTILDTLVDEGKLYLFKIKNQDYNSNKALGHKNNLHTIYWQAVFGDILNKPKLNGEAEIFYRTNLKTLDKIKDAKGKEIIKNYRYSKEKFIFHCPITLNFCLKNRKINDLINEEFSKNPKNINFLGIDRGEKHLAYYYIVNQKGEKIKEGTLNLAFDKPVLAEKWFEDTTKSENDRDRWYKKEIECNNYNDLLDARASNRDMARKNWQTIGNIKDLKDGYISHIVRKIVDLAIENNAFIVLENLNIGFKNSRKKIEKQVYQKLELALAKKLNFVVDKNANPGEIMSVQNAIQLTAPVENFSDIENAKQYGIILYVRANYTSITDPITGWRKSIYLKKGSEDNIKTQICENFSDFGFDGKDYYFEYKYLDKNWILYSGNDGKSLDRYRGRKDNYNNWQIESQNIVEILDGVFESFDKTKSFKSQILDEGIELRKIGDSTSWESLRFAIDLIQQIRNSGPKDSNGIGTRDDDFILSPVRDSDGKHFDSRDFLNIENSMLPNSGDANGAYNIARKGIMMFERIKENPKKPKLFISDEDWDKYLQKSLLK